MTPSLNIPVRADGASARGIVERGKTRNSSLLRGAGTTPAAHVSSRPTFIFHGSALGPWPFTAAINVFASGEKA